MPDTSENRVHLMYLPLLEDLPGTFQYSWCSAMLACLYRGLCRAAIINDQKEIEGCLVQLQSWTYDHILMLAPRLQDPTLPSFPLVRRWLQHLITTNIPGHAFLWTSYIQMAFLPNVVEICRSCVPLIYFAIVEWHAPDRVIRQFVMDQSIPQDLVDCAKLHKIDLRGKSDYNWPHKHRRWIQMWNDRENYVVDGLPNTVFMSEYSSNFVYSTGREMMEALATINPTTYSTNYFETPPAQHFHMPQTESPQQTHVETHYQAHTPQQQHSYGFHNYSSTHLSSSSQFSLRPSIFAASSSTPLSAYDSQQYYRPTMLPTNIFRIQHTNDEVVIEDDDEEDEDEQEEEQPQLTTRAGGRISQRNEQQLRVQPPRRKPPSCDTSSHRRH
ncbi:hypothetical protein Lal_00019381 [Lupinus albus]|nr:hypothetical protein Lal_00019381 [Lupinus albus]